MKVFLLHADRDFTADGMAANEQDLRQDLELDTLFAAMAGGDRYLFDVAGSVALTSLTRPEEIRYRQGVLTDCLQHPDVVRDLYDVAMSAIRTERKVWGYLRDTPEPILHRSVQVMELLVEELKRLRVVADEHASAFRSEGFCRFFTMIAEELDDAYFAEIEAHLQRLKFRDGTLMSARLGRGHKGIDYVLRRLNREKRSLLDRLPLRNDGSALSFRIADRDESGFRALGDLRDQGINLVANAMAQSTDHVVSFFAVLRFELAFYLGCMNLERHLRDLGHATCLPVPEPSDGSALSAEGLYDACLSLTLGECAVDNDLEADGKRLLVVTGANQGGKSTFLRALGLAHVMLQAGMFVPARSLRAAVTDGLFTHFKREEDATMKHGKLDEELNRMSDLADAITPRGLLLCNESFASTNEREGSEIARQIVRAMIDGGVRVAYVTHLFELADGFRRDERDDTLFLRAERREDGTRTYKLVEGAPLPTSFGKDLYDRIFGASEPALIEAER